MSQLRREFERTYGVDLLPVSAATVQLGEIWDWIGVFFPILKRTMDHLPLIGPDPDMALDLELKDVPLSNASIPDVEMKESTTVKGDIKVPSLNLDLSEELDADKIVSFQFQNITSKDVSGILKSKIQNYLSKLKEKNYKLYADNIKHKNVAVWLFYAGSVSLEIEKNVSNKAAIEAKIKSVEGVNVSVDTTSETTIKYKITGNNNCPFAAQFIKGNNL